MRFLSKKHFLALSLFFAGALTSSWFGWLQPIATVEISNDSEETIETIDIVCHGTMDSNATISKLLPGQRV